ncbi:RimJ/RimL family protein N-acetyltransferase [Bacillus mesophilus]|uniref:GNAT family N-acetyltransferase n=1 Tax=Bacillus mesophilus TaxID=1808955 RepID=A0A6M0Q8Y1_9BACI|nr:GNAT family N-acetyltransferase [Bacillus mesophilus]MBM7660990.1 RimJ/RimL family protein N-acetyltransferase [Bacillus mesophilus]NEY71468.1 GNAT family N-acetyltransferase [Bacillus mesophilus]
MELNVQHAQPIKIRPLTIEDFGYVLNWSQDDSFCSANEWEKKRNKEELFRWWEGCVKRETDDFIRMGIEFEKRLIGYVDLACIKGKTAELGIAIGESDLWGNGIGVKSCLCMMEFAVKNLGITVFYAETHETNNRSRKMLDKIGFKEISRNGSETYLGKESQLIQYSCCIGGEL